MTASFEFLRLGDNITIAIKIGGVLVMTVVPKMFFTDRVLYIEF